MPFSRQTCFIDFLGLELFLNFGTESLNVDWMIMSRYFKAKNILVAYSIIMYRDKDVIELWVWALVEDLNTWYIFPWGSYSFQILCHGISVLKKNLNEIGIKRKVYHFYGPIWKLHIWSYEVIPDLGRMYKYRNITLEFLLCLMWMIRKSATNYLDIFYINIVTIEY